MVHAHQMLLKVCKSFRSTALHATMVILRQCTRAQRSPVSSIHT